MKAIRALLFGGILFVTGSTAASAESDFEFPPSPYPILGLRLDAVEIDAVAACLGEAPILAEALAALREGDPNAAFSVLSRRMETANESVVSEIRLAMALLAARRSASDAEVGELETVRKQLAAALARPASAETTACGWLELARLELRSGRVPESRLSALRAWRLYAANALPDRIRLAARFYRAESLARSGDLEAALEIHRALSVTKSPVAKASQLRLADAEQNRSASHAHRLEVESLITANPGTSAVAWAPRIAEWAISEGDLEAARRWIDLATQSELPQPEALNAALMLRRADLLYASGQRSEKEEARRILHGFSENHGSAAIQRLALVREIDLSRRADEGAILRLERTFERGNRRLAAYAGEVMARSLLASGQYERALEILVDIAHRKADVAEGQTDPALFDEILSALSANASCDAWVDTVSGRRDLLLRHASRPEPFLRLGDCYRQVGMAAAAVETYRGIAKSFGPKIIGAITLRSAQAEFLLGRIAAARAAAKANIRSGAKPRDAWRLLLARIQISDGMDLEAVRTLRPVLKQLAKIAKPEYGPDDHAVILLSARAAARTHVDSAERALLRRALAREMRDDAEVRVLAEAALIVADLHRQAGEFEAARKLYDPAFAHLEDGPLRSRAAYWLGVLAAHPDEARAVWSRVAESQDPWARLAANEIALAAGRADVGESLAVPSTRRLPSKTGESR